MTPDITINVNLPSGGAVAAGDASGEAAAPPPMPIAELQSSFSSDGSQAPGPVAPDLLSSATEDTGPQPPMAIENLLSAMPSEAPVPANLESLETLASGPTPTLQAGEFSDTAEAPAPMPFEALESAEENGKGRKK